MSTELWSPRYVPRAHRQHGYAHPDPGRGRARRDRVRVDLRARVCERRQGTHRTHSIRDFVESLCALLFFLIVVAMAYAAVSLFVYLFALVLGRAVATEAT